MPVVDLGAPAPPPTCTQWVTVDQLGCAVTGLASPDQVTLAIEAASEVLWALSGRRFGYCPVQVRPCRQRCITEPWPMLTERWSTYDYGLAPNLGTWFSWFSRCGACINLEGDCGCTRLAQIELPRPVGSISQVTVDGVVLAPNAYRVDRHRYLVRLDGGAWPTCQDMSLDLGQANTFGVSLLRGRAIPRAGTMAATELACELVKAYAGVKCKLPDRMTALTRNGVSITALDPMTFLTKGLSGMYRVDLFLASYNRNGLRRRGSVASPDDLRRRHQIV